MQKHQRFDLVKTRSNACVYCNLPVALNFPYMNHQSLHQNYAIRWLSVIPEAINLQKHSKLSKVWFDESSTEYMRVTCLARSIFLFVNLQSLHQNSCNTLALRDTRNDQPTETFKSIKVWLDESSVECGHVTCWICSASTRLIFWIRLPVIQRNLVPYVKQSSLVDIVVSLASRQIRKGPSRSLSSEKENKQRPTHQFDATIDDRAHEQRSEKYRSNGNVTFPRATRRRH